MKKQLTAFTISLLSVVAIQSPSSARVTGNPFIQYSGNGVFRAEERVNTWWSFSRADSYCKQKYGSQAYHAFASPLPLRYCFVPFYGNPQQL